MKRLLVIAALAALVSAPASANIIFNLSGVQLDGGGEVTGYFTTSDDLTTLVDLSLSVPGATIGAYTFLPVTYSFTDTINYQLPLNSHITVTKAGPGGEKIQLWFGALTATGATVGTNSWDHSAAAGNRNILPGGLLSAAPAVDPTPAPEPASWTLALAGLGLIGAAFARRRSAAATA